MHTAATRSHSVPLSETRSFLAGLAGLATLTALMHGHPVPGWVAGILTLAATAIPMALIHWLTIRVQNQPDSGLSLGTPPQWNVRRGLVKYVGLVATVGLLGAAYAVFPIYHDPLYQHFRAAAAILPYLLVAALPYCLWIDAHMTQPEDGYWHAGCLVTGQWEAVDPVQIRAHLLGWTVKGFFLPLMFTYLANNMLRILGTSPDTATFLGSYEQLTVVVGTLDTLFACMGYLLTLRILNSHIRSTEPTLYGWTVAILCYDPFWAFCEANYLNFRNGEVWTRWFANHPALTATWGSTILILLAIYTWATLVFGFRFSNLTHRGIITHGPYRYLKHPAYLTKIMTFWMIELPFLTTGPWSLALRRTILLALLSGIYYLRAKTEEAHLSQDPTYAEYAQWMDTHGLWAQIRNTLGR